MTISIPTQYLGNSSFIGFARETTYGTAVAAATYAPFISETLASDPNIMPVPTIRGSRSGYTVRVQGEYKVAGDIMIPFFVSTGMQLLACAFGKDTYATSTHTITTVDGALPSLTLEKGFGGGLQSMQYSGCVISKAALKFTTNAVAEATYSFMGQQDTLITATTPSFASDVTPYALLNFSATINATSAPFITAIDLEVDNGAKAFYSFQGTKYAGLVYGGERKVSGKITILLQDFALWTAAAGNTSIALVFTVSVDGTHQVVFTLPTCVLGQWSAPLKFGEITVIEIPFQANAVPGSYDIQAVAKTADTTAYTA